MILKCVITSVDYTYMCSYLSSVKFKVKVK